MRTIKFRGWDKETHRMLPYTKEHPLKVGDGVLVADYVEVMQFTGLLDKNGKEIYEGDILRWNRKKDGFPVEYQYHEVKWLNYEGQSMDSVDFIGFNSGITHMEIIGNIYENPDLLDT